MQRTITALICLIFAVTRGAFALPEFEVTVQTTSCNGDTGFSSFASNKLFKIQEARCSDPNDPSKQLKYMLVHSDTLKGSYDALWVTADEAEHVMAQIKEGRAIKMQRYTQPNVRIEVKRHTAAANEPLSAEKADDNPPSEPQIVIIDPAINLTRSAPEVFMSTQLSERTVVGKVEAEAGLTSITVNGMSANFDDNGLFKATVALSGNKTAVEVVAVDKRGTRSSYTFHINSPQKTASQEKKPAVNGIFGNYHALIIANNDYAHMDKLLTPKNDASQLEQLLKNKFGFSVEVLENANRYTLLTALNAARERLTEQDNLLIYYAGHGAYDKKNNRGHWLPIDAEPNSTANWVSTIEITDIVNSMAAKHILLVADACYSGALTRATYIDLDAGKSPQAQALWINKMAQLNSRHVLMSGGIKPVLDDGGNGHSVFANAFIEVLRQSEGVIDGSALFQHVKTKVEIRAQQLNVEQSPKFAKLLNTEDELGQFLLVENDRQL